ncbi:MAG: hypothetical protein HN996_07940 [Opitutae bacterium]|nr:hypothetical protein [Opitutae bacterium]
MLINSHAALWDNTSSIDGWKSNWLGFFYSDSNSEGWIYHQHIGWLYAQGSDESSIWFYWPEQGWFWSNNTSFPLIWGSHHSNWYYYYFVPASPPVQSTIWLYSFATTIWGNRIVYRPPDPLNGETLVIETSSAPGHVEANYKFGATTYTAALKRSQLGMTIPIEISGTYDFKVDANAPETLICDLTIDHYKITMSTFNGPATIEGTATEVSTATGLPVTTSATVTLTASKPNAGIYDVRWTYTSGLADQESGNISW